VLAELALPARRCLPPRRRKAGIAELREHLLQLSARPHPQHQRFRLAIDRAFTVKGAGWW
jgi:selenocysteine-specific translation elongation factor